MGLWKCREYLFLVDIKDNDHYQPSMLWEWLKDPALDRPYEWLWLWLWQSKRTPIELLTYNCKHYNNGISPTDNNSPRSPQTLKQSPVDVEMTSPNDVVIDDSGERVFTRKGSSPTLSKSTSKTNASNFSPNDNWLKWWQSALSSTSWTSLKKTASVELEKSSKVEDPSETVSVFRLAIRRYPWVWLWMLRREDWHEIIPAGEINELVEFETNSNSKTKNIRNSKSTTSTGEPKWYSRTTSVLMDCLRDHCHFR